MHRVRIVDAEALRAVLQEVYRRWGSHRKAARWLGIEKHTFTKLLTGTVEDAISHATYSRILEALGGRVSERGPLRGPVLDFAPEPTDLDVEREMHRTGKTAEQEEQAREDLWEAASAEALEEATLLERFQSSVLDEDAQFIWASYSSWLDLELKRLEPKVNVLLPFLSKHRVYWSMIEKFIERTGGWSEPLWPEEPRIRLAVFRALEPLTAAEATEGVERSIQDLHLDGVLARFLRAALRCEQILLERERDLERAQSADPPMEYGAWVAGVGEPKYEERNPVPPEDFWESLLGENGEADGEAD